MKKNIKQHPLIQTLLGLDGNPKTLTFLEPLWGIPNSLIAPYATLYMYNLGVTDIQIGLLLSLSMIVQVFFAFGGGIITDTLGRKTTTIIGDFLGWVIPCIIWAVSQNFWFFLVAILLNSFEQVNQTAWTCLLIEDADQKDILNIYVWITIAALLAVFFAPISGILVGKTSVIPVMRVLYLIYALSMLTKCIITFLFTKETKQGIIRKKETKNQSLQQILHEYKYILPKIFKDITIILLLGIMVILHITSQINNNFFSLYVTSNLGIPDNYLAFFSIFRAIIMLVFMFTIQAQLNKLPIKLPMSAGFIIYIIGQMILIFHPGNSLFSVISYTIIESIAFALVMPRKDSLLALYIDPEERARIVSVLGVITFAFASPFGYLVGVLSSFNRMLPFVLNLILYLTGFVIIVKFKETVVHEEAFTDD